MHIVKTWYTYFGYDLIESDQSDLIMVVHYVILIYFVSVIFVLSLIRLDIEFAGLVSVGGCCVLF